MKIKGLKCVLVAMSIVCAFMWGVPQQVQADVIYSSFGPGDSYGGASLVVGWQEAYGLYPEGQRDLSVLFIPNDSFTLDLIKFAAYYYEGGGLEGSENALTIYITPNKTSWGPDMDSPLESFTFTGLSTTAAIYSAVSSAQPLLASGTEYWFVMSPAYGTQIAWVGSSASPPSGLPYPWIMDGSMPGGGIIYPAYSIEGTRTALPEPITLLLVGLGLVGVLGIRRKMHRNNPPHHVF
jgi:hypothetical protein